MNMHTSQLITIAEPFTCRVLYTEYPISNSVGMGLQENVMFSRTHTLEASVYGEFYCQALEYAANTVRAALKRRNEILSECAAEQVEAICRMVDFGLYTQDADKAPPDVIDALRRLNRDSQAAMQRIQVTSVEKSSKIRLPGQNQFWSSNNNTVVNVKVTLTAPSGKELTMVCLPLQAPMAGMAPIGQTSPVNGGMGTQFQQYPHPAQSAYDLKAYASETSQSPASDKEEVIDRSGVTAD